jgi:hypothetical protein
LAVGSAFTWKTGDLSIKSVLRRVDPEHTLCWTGRAWHIVAAHCWMLHELPGGQTAIEMRESMDGAFIEHLYSSAELLRADQEWLARLRKTTETQ